MAKNKSSKNEKKIQEGRGQGHGKNYQPWIKIGEISSHGWSSRIKGYKTGRIHHFLSKNETNYFYILEYSSIVKDIREQFPLPLEETVKIAASLGIKHPTNPKSQELEVITTDFLIDLVDSKKPIARTIKMSDKLDNTRVLEKFEIERIYWKRRGVDWGILTEKDIPQDLVENIQWIYDSLNNTAISNMNPILFQEIENKFFYHLQDGMILAHAACAIEEEFKLKDGMGLSIFQYFIASHKWLTNMNNKIKTDEPIIISKNLNSKEN